MGCYLFSICSIQLRFPA